MSHQSQKARQVIDTALQTVLITAFEPFGLSEMNASERILSAVIADEHAFANGILPVRWASIRNVIDRLILETCPEFIIMLGEAGPDEQIQLEQLAHNEDDFQIPDNDGLTITRSTISTTGKDIYSCRVNLDDIVNVVPTAAEFSPVSVSLNAGKFLCNHAYYYVLDTYPGIPCLFIHVPAWRPNSPEEMLNRAARTVRFVVNRFTAILPLLTKQ